MPREPDPEPQSAACGRSDRSLKERGTTAVGILIVLLSIFSAYVTWRGAIVSGTAADLDQRARQERILEGQTRGQLRGSVAYEQGLFRSYEQHVRLAEELDRDAVRTAGIRPEGARLLAAEADTERGVARSVQALFPIPIVANGQPTFHPRATLRSLVANSELKNLQPAELEEAARRARSKRFGLVTVGTAVIAAIFCLTVALLGAAFRPTWALTGAVIGLVGVLAGVGIILFFEVPAA